ncbi:histidine kinase [Tumidithrix helvetica PCC 7403]|uniref:ATP-binding protein n=1 Tax=Tumidithrix helvetica TaxID=3457545 RepID=UPI003CBC6BA4
MSNRKVSSQTSQKRNQKPDSTNSARVEDILWLQQQRFNLIAEVTLKIQQSLPFQEILQATVTGAQHILRAERVSLYQVLPKGTGKVICEAVLSNYPALLDLEFPKELFPVEDRQLYAGGHVRAIADVRATNEGLPACVVEFCDRYNIKAQLIVPIWQNQNFCQQNQSHSQNPLWGFLIAHRCDRSHQWVDFELELMQQLAYQISIALAQAQLLEHLEETLEAHKVNLQEVNRSLEREISARMRSEESLLRSDEFIAELSHELRNPLTSLQSTLKLLDTGQLGTIEGRQMLEIANKNAERLVRLVHNLLDLQRIKSEDFKMEKQACNASTLMIHAVEMMQPMAQQYGVVLAVKPVDIQILVDSDSIIQVLINLLSNAIKFSFHGGTVWLNIECKEDKKDGEIDREVLFCICDRGHGIPSDKLEIVFERFQQVDLSESRRKGGTGLGLAICRKIIERHGGRIWVESNLGKGSSFFFTLPLLNA